MKRVDIESKRRIFDDFFKIDEIHLSYERFDGGMSHTRRQLVFERGDSVAAVLMNKETSRVILISQFRYPTYEKGPGWLVETIAGRLETDESPEEAIRREILDMPKARMGKNGNIRRLSSMNRFTCLIPTCLSGKTVIT